MHLHLKKSPRADFGKLFRRTAGWLASLAILNTLQQAAAGDINWYNGSGTLWTNILYWTNSASANVAPGAGDNAIFNSGFGGNPITINASPVTTIQVGSITYGSACTNALVLKCQSTGPALTTLNLNGVGGILLSNYSSTYSMSFVRTNANNATAFLALSLGASGIISANNSTGTAIPATAGSIVLNLPVGETGGSHGITLTGSGLVYLRGTNTYSGPTIISNGVLQVDDVGTIGNGTGTLYFSGGNLETSSSSITRLLANPIVVNNPGYSYIFNNSGTASTRVLIFSGSLTGTSGTLVLANPASNTNNNTLDVQMRGSFNFALPLVVGDNLGDAFNDNTPNNNYAELQLANTFSAGPQIFSGNISGDGPIIRGNLPSVAVSGDNGVTIFTASNSYTGGTSINNGTLYCNNTAGSALGSGSVVVTNTGVLGGNGFVTAPAAVSLGGTIQPGVTNTSVGNLSMNGGLTFNPGANYNVQISSATGSPGTAWDVLTCNNGWTDGGNGTTLININLTSTSAISNWNNTLAYSWLIITNNGSSTGFNAANWTVTTAGFTASNSIAGTFSLSTDANGDLLLNYTPTSGNILINVPGGSVAQGGVSPINYPVLTGLNSVTKVGNGEVILTNSLNSYQGTTYILAGTASAAVNSATSGGAFGATTAPIILGNTNGTTNATLNISQPNVLVANAVTVQSGSTGTKTIGTTVNSGAVTNSGNVTLNDNVTLSVPAGGSDSFLGNFSGAGGITFSGGGTFAMGGLGSYAGTTALTGGTLDLNAKALGTNTFTISAASTLDNTSGGSVTLNSAPINLNADIDFVGSSSLNLGAGAVTMSANRTLEVDNNVLTIGGPIAGSAALTKTGAGELIFGSPTNCTYTGGTTNLAGILAINGTATFGDGTGSLVFSGGNLLDTGSRAGLPVANPVIINSSTRIYGNSADTTAPNRYLPFTGAFTVNNGSTLYIDNTGSATTIFNLTLQGTNYTAVNWPIVIGDSSFDNSGALTVLNLLNDNTTPVQTIGSLISGTGSVIRGANTLNTGGTSILTQQNTFTGGVALYSGALGVGASSVVSGGAVVSGPLGTGTLTLGNSNGETNLTIFAAGGPVQIDNKILLNGNTNFTFGGTNNLTFTGDVNSGGVAKSLGVAGGISVTFSGALTNASLSGGGALTKVGGGKLIFSGNSTYIGSTTVSAGTLLVNGSLYTNTVTANSGGTFGGKGALGGSLVFNSGAQAYLFKSAGSPDSPLTVASNLTLNANAVTVDLGGTATLGAGTYTLLTYGGTLSGAFTATPTFVNGSLAGGNIATIDLSTPNQVNLIVAAGSYTPPNFPAGSLTRTVNGNISLTATGAIGSTYRLWTTTNLALHPVTNTWTLLNSGTVTASPFTNFDLTATNYPQRFYLFTTP